MPDSDLIDLFVLPLNRAGLLYMVTGSVASMLYAEPRFTADVDVVARVNSPEELRAAFSGPDYYCPPVDVIAIEIARPLHGHVNVLHTPSALKADVYLAGRTHCTNGRAASAIFWLRSAPHLADPPGGDRRQGLRISVRPPQ